MSILLVIKFKALLIAFLKIVRVQIKDLSELRPEYLINLVKVKVKHRNLIAQHDLLILLIDKNHQQHCVEIV